MHMDNIKYSFYFVEPTKDDVWGQDKNISYSAVGESVTPTSNTCLLYSIRKIRCFYFHIKIFKFNRPIIIHLLWDSVFPHFHIKFFDAKQDKFVKVLNCRLFVHFSYKPEFSIGR